MSGDHNAHQNDFNPDWDTIKPFEDRHVEDTALLRECLEALNRSDYLGWQLQIPLIKKLKERLSQSTTHPCAGRNCGSTNPNLHSAECFEDYEKSTGAREWKGLTDEAKAVINAARAAMDESTEAYDSEGSIKIASQLAASLSLCLDEYDRAIEAKLKEKNT